MSEKKLESPALNGTILVVSEPIENGNQVNNSTEQIGFWNLSSMRFYVALLLCFSVFLNCLMRTNLSMGMVCMVNSTALALLHEDSRQFINHAPDDANSTTVTPDADELVCKLPTVARAEYEGSFTWTSDQQAMLFAAMFWGGLISGFPAGWLADRYGPKNILLGSILSNIIGSLLSPIAAERGGYVALFVVRFFMGIGQGLQYPCIAAMMSRWYPPAERSTVIAIYTAGNQIGSITVMPLGAWLCEQKQFLGGWPAIFYTAGSFGIIWCVIWTALLTNSPEKNRKISRVESQFIQLELQSQNLQNRKTATKQIPWRSIVSSTPLMANMLAMFVANVLGGLLQSYLPTYFKDVLLLDIKSNGFYSALPFLVQWITKFICAPVADALKKRTKISHTLICKVFQCLGNLGTGIMAIGLCFVTCLHPGIALALVCGVCAFFSCMICGFMTSLVSIAPQYTGTVNSVSRIAGQLGALGAPYLVGFVTVHGSQSEWRTVFMIFAIVDIAVGLVYAFFGSAEIQEWAKIPVNKESQIPLCVTESSVKMVQGARSDVSLEKIDDPLLNNPDAHAETGLPDLSKRVFGPTFHLDHRGSETSDEEDEVENSNTFVRGGILKL